MEESNYYEVTAEFRMEVEDKHGNMRIKRRKERYLVQASSTEYALTKTHKFLEGEVSDQYSDWALLGVKQSNIETIIP